MRASEDLLDLIHNLTATSIREELERAARRAALPKDDEDYQALNPQLVDKAMKFLKDNGVDAPARSKRVDSLADTLSQLDIDTDDPSLISRMN